MIFYVPGTLNNVSISTTNGRVTSIYLGKNALVSGNDYRNMKREETDKDEFLNYLDNCLSIMSQERHPSSFMQLYLSITDDEDALIIAKKYYEKNVNKIDFPYDILKKLHHYRLDNNSINKQIFKITPDGLNYLKVENGIVIMLNQNIDYRIFRNNVDFYRYLRSLLKDMIDVNPHEFMKLYRTIENDNIIVKLTDDIRKEKLQELQNTIDFFNV